MRFIIICLLLTFLSSCKSEKKMVPRSFSQVEINTLLEDSLLNVRALEISHESFSFATSNGEIGGQSYDWVNGGDLIDSAKKTFQLKYDSIIPNFRSLAITNNAGFLIAICHLSTLLWFLKSIADSAHYLDVH